MSIESAKAFIEKMNTDAEFAKRAMEQKGKEQISAFLKAEGYEFSEEDFKAASECLAGTELSDENLSSVTGGHCAFGCSWG